MTEVSVYDRLQLPARRVIPQPTVRSIPVQHPCPFGLHSPEFRDRSEHNDRNSSIQLQRPWISLTMSQQIRPACPEIHLPMLRTALLIILLALPAARATAIDFAHDVVPVLKEHCAECHTGEKSEGGFLFNTRRLLMESEAVVSGNPADSKLIELITSTDRDNQMPPADRPRVPGVEARVLEQWIAEGTPWEPGFRFGTSGYEPPLFPRDVTLPPAQFDGQHPIDRILHQYTQQQQLPEMQPVPDSVFLRRVYLDLIGLLPTPEQQRQFHSSDSPERRSELIKELLARQQDYADHWMTFWNDLLRNAYKGTGFIDGGRRQITGWLYESLLDNKPYDEFVRELIAPAAPSEGFIRGIKWRGDVNASQVREIQFAQNVGQVFLGINMKCASCHDSFIDRWTLDEAYGLAAVFSERDLEIHRCDKPTGRIAKAAWIFPELGTIDAAAEQPERLKQLSRLITDPRNGRTSRTIVNRLWHRLMGHGIVHPVDAMHTAPWNEDLLDYLANELVAADYDLKYILEHIATSSAYQSVAAPAIDNASGDKFVFRGPVARHLTAEQFLDAVWQLTGTSPGQIQAPVPIQTWLGNDGAIAETKEQWIWAYAGNENVPAGETVRFLRTITLLSVPDSVYCLITCDNEYTLIVNGTEVRKDSNFAEPDMVAIGPHLRPGNNEIVVLGRNAGSNPNPAGLFAEFFFGTENNSVLIKDSGWQAGIVSTSSAADLQPATVVTNQNFLGAEINNRLRLASRRLLVGQSRLVRASMINSNLLMRSLGRPNREQIVTTRPESLSTLQAIDLANGEILDGLLAVGGRNMLPNLEHPARFINHLFLSTLCRIPHDSERELALNLLGESPTTDSIQDLLWTVIMLPEFQFVR